MSWGAVGGVVRVVGALALCAAVLGVVGPRAHAITFVNGCPATVIGLDGIEVLESAEITGDIASKLTVTVGKGARILDASGNAVSGTEVFLAEWALIDGNVRADAVHKGNNARITGTVRAPPLPLGPLPTVSVTPGVEPVIVPKLGVRTLAPGAYKSIWTGESAVIHFTGGQYDTAALQIGKGTSLIFDGATIINVRDDLQLGENVVLTGTGNLTSADIRVNYEGSATALFGKGTRGALTLVAPNGLIQVGESGEYSGQIWGKRVSVGKGVRIVGATCKAPPTVEITSPANFGYFNITPTTVTGTVDDPTAAVTVNDIPAAVVNGRFSMALPLAEGPNPITAIATTPDGAVGAARILVTLDTTPPRVTITSPPDQFVTTEGAVTVSGSVNDIVVGTVNNQEAQVKVNGVDAQVANRMFVAAGVPLAIGPNVIQAVGRDRVGNAATTQITVVRKAVTAEAKIGLVSGNNQSAAIRSAVAAPLVVRLTDASGSPVPNKPVIFKVTDNDGLVKAGAAPAPTVVTNTDGQGRAQVQWTLGGRAGAGGNIVQAYAVGFDGTAIFTATGALGPADKIVVDTGNNQIGPIGQPLPKPFIAVVIDAGNNRLGGVPVTFTVGQGGGSFGGQQTYNTVTDSDGRAAATLTLGLQEGEDNNLASVTFPSNQGFPAAFTASGRVPGDPAKTMISGVVLDNSNVPISGVTVRALLTNVMHSNANATQTAQSGQTDAQGQFSIPQAPVGFVKLIVDGSTAQRPGVYPSLEYDMVTVAGRVNTVGQPIFLLPLTTANQLCVTNTTGGGTLTIPEAPGFSLTFGPGQVTFPGGSKSGCVSVSVVHGDKVPMAPGFGQQPRFIVTIQPAGSVFNPPAPITLPNVDGLKPRAVTELYSFDHDISSFVAIGTGTVSNDGLVIVSNPGVGVLKAGWHCGGDPQARGTVADCPVCKFCAPSGSAVCVPSPGLAGKPCSSPFNNCYSGGICGGTALSPTGVCEGGKPLNGNACDPGGGDTGICEDGHCLGSESCASQCLPVTPNECMVYCKDGACVNPETPVPDFFRKPCTKDGTRGVCVAGSCERAVSDCTKQSPGTACIFPGGRSGTCDGHDTCRPWVPSCIGELSGTPCFSGGQFPGHCDDNQLCQGTGIGGECVIGCRSSCTNGHCNDCAPDSPPVRTPAPSVIPPPMLINAVGSEGFGVTPPPSPFDGVLKCEDVCVGGITKTALIGDIQPAPNWRSLIFTRIDVPNCRPSSRTSANIQRTIVHEAKHAQFYVNIINVYKNSLGKIYEDRQSCIDALALLFQEFSAAIVTSCIEQCNHTRFTDERFAVTCDANGDSAEFGTGLFYPAPDPICAAKCR